VVRCICQWPVELCALGFSKEGLLVEEGASPEEEWPAWSLGFYNRTARRRGSESKGMASVIAGLCSRTARHRGSESKRNGQRRRWAL
jgi:hypothetical protein